LHQVFDLFELDVKLRYQKVKCIQNSLTWAEGIRRLKGEMGLMEEDWNDRSNWWKKII
jgi:hypothetical protein